MTQPNSSLRRTAVLALQQIALAAVMFLLVFTWLHIPDANVVEVIASVLLAVVIAAVAGAGESFIALRLMNRSANIRRLLLGTFAVLVAILLWQGVSIFLDHLSANDGLHAGYLNSRFPASWRNVVSYDRLLVFFSWLWRALRWFVASLLAAVTFACITANGPLQGLLFILRSRSYWRSILLVLIAAGISDALLSWTPGKGLRVQLVSLSLRLFVVIAGDSIAIAMLLQAMASAIQTPGGTEPAAIHPRTAAIP